MVMLCYVLAALCLVYCVGVVATKAAGTKFYLIWLAGAALFGMFGFFVQKGLWMRLPIGLRAGIGVLAGVGIQNVRTSLQVTEGTAYVVTAGVAVQIPDVVKYLRAVAGVKEVDAVVMVPK